MTYIESSQPTPGRDAWLGASHGYRIAGDWACLNAELALSDQSETLAQQWALQLWACDQPYQGGALAGIKIAEAPVDLNPSQPQHLYAETFARLPAGDREYAMVLVLASRSHDAHGAEEQVHDFANYPAREHFCVPALRGEVSFARAERVENPRGEENLSGTLALELWALNEPYQGEQFTGTALAGVELGRLAGQQALHDVQLPVAADALATHKHLTVMLREWTATGYVTRDFRNVDVSAAAPDPEVAAAQPTTETASVVPVPAITAPAEPGLVSIQHGTLEQLAAVPGLSKKVAQEIIKTRPFSSLDELTRVRGIGDKTLRKLRAALTL
jgi:DNA uptake protein ComE-like DNA-binding protein